MHHLALTGKFWLRSRISFKESNFGTDKILDAAWKLRSAGRVTGSSSSFVSYIFNKLRQIKRRPETIEVRGEKLFADIQKTQLYNNSESVSTLHFPHFERSHFTGAFQEVSAKFTKLLLVLRVGFPGDNGDKKRLCRADVAAMHRSEVAGSKSDWHVNTRASQTTTLCSDSLSKLKLWKRSI